MSTIPPQVLEFMRLVSVDAVEFGAFLPAQRISCEVDGRSCLDVAAAFVDVLEVNGGSQQVWLVQRFGDSVFCWSWSWTRANGREYPWAGVENLRRGETP